MRRATRLGAVLAACALVASATAASAHPTHDGSGKEAGFDMEAEETSPGGVPQGARITDARCEDGMAADLFACHKIDLAAFVPLAEFDSLFANDIWGWTDPTTGHEYALVSTFEGVEFFDVTTPTNPVHLGRMATEAPNAFGNIWGDVKTYENVMYHGTEAATGVQVFDLTRLRDVTEAQDWTPDNVIDEMGQSHNLAVNEDTGHLFVVGSGSETAAASCGEEIGGGPMVFDLTVDAIDPPLASCIAEDGYTHDIQCVTYDGPDAEHQGEEICMAANEDTLTVWQTTDPTAPVMLDRQEYDTSAYTHQGWLTEDHEYFLLGDEIDELAETVESRTTYLWDVRDLDDIQLIEGWASGNPSIDHNIFIKDGLAYQSNYTAGLQVYDTYKVDKGELTLRGMFDVYPADDATAFAGTWGNYPYFDSGTVVVSGTEEGLFVLTDRSNAAQRRK